MKLSELKAFVDAQVAHQKKFGNDPEVWYINPLSERVSRITGVATLEGRSLESMFAEIKFVDEENGKLPENKLPYANHPMFLLTDKDPEYLN